MIEPRRTTPTAHDAAHDAPRTGPHDPENAATLEAPAGSSTGSSTGTTEPIATQQMSARLAEGGEDGAAPDDQGHGDGDGDGDKFVVDSANNEVTAFRVATVALLFPIVFAAFRNAVSNWVPIGDSAYFTARSLDVGTRHTPLIGAWSSGSLQYAHPVNSLGPLELYLLAPFTHLAPGGGTAIGVALVQFAAVATIIVVLRGLYGIRGALAGMVGVAWLVWAMGSENLVAAVQHPYLILPFAATMVTTVGALGGQRWAVVPLVVFGSLCVQTHLSYPILIAVLLLIAAIGQYQWWRCGDQQDRKRINIATGIALMTGFVLWIPPLIDQFFGTGNLVAALTQGGGDEYPTGFRLGARIVATVATQPSTLGPHGFTSVHLNEHIVSGVRAGVLLAMIGAGVVLSAWAFKTRRSTLFYWSLVLSSIAIAMIINAALIPGSVFGYRVDNYRWIWSWLGVGATAVWLGIDSVVGRPNVVGQRIGRSWARWGPMVLAGVVCVLGTWNLGQRGMPNMVAYRGATDDVSALTSQLDEYLDTHQIDGPVLIDDTHLYFGAPYNYPVTAVLLRHGVEVRFPSRIYGYRFGADRVADGTETLVLAIWVDEDALEREPSLIAFSNVLQPSGLELTPIGDPGGDGPQTPSAPNDG